MKDISVYLRKVVDGLGPMGRLLPRSKGLSIFTSFFPLDIVANIKVGDRECYVLNISREESFFKAGYDPRIHFTLQGSETTWLDIFKGESTLLSEYLAGRLFISFSSINTIYYISLVFARLTEWDAPRIRLVRFLARRPVNILVMIFLGIGVKLARIIPAGFMDALLARMSKTTRIHPENNADSRR